MIDFRNCLRHIHSLTLTLLFGRTPAGHQGGDASLKEHIVTLNADRYTPGKKLAKNLDEKNLVLSKSVFQQAVSNSLLKR